MIPCLQAKVFKNESERFDLSDGIQSIFFDADAGESRLLQFRTGTSARWKVGANNTAEAGANAGSDFRLQSFNDAGSFIETVLLITRSTGLAAFGGALTTQGGFACNGLGAQTAYASGSALAGYGAGANGLDSGGAMSALHALVVSMRAALVANGIMS